MLPYIRKAPQAKQQGSFTQDNFAGGLNNVSGDTIIADNQLTNSQNLMFTSDNTMEKRYGLVAFDELNLEGAITMVGEYKPVIEDSEIVRSTDTEVYIGATKVADIAGTAYGINYIGNYYFVDGNELRVYNGEGTYVIKEDPKAYAMADILETEPSPVVITIDNLDFRTAVGDTIQHETYLGIIPYTITDINYETNQITIAETLTNPITAGDLIRLYVPRPKEIYFEGQVVYDDLLGWAWYEPCDYELEDSLKGENYIPNNPSVITIRNDRIHLSGDSLYPHNIYMSDINNPFYYPAALGLQCPPNGDEIVDMFEFDDALIVARHNDMYAVYGNSADLESTNLFRMKKIDTHIGFFARNAYAILNNYVFYLGYDKRFYRMTTPMTNIEYLVTKPLTDIVDLTLAPLSLTDTDFQYISTVAFNNEFMMNIGNKTIVYSFGNQGFTFYTGWNARSLYTDGIDVYVGNTNGILSKWTKGVYSDLGVAIESIQETKRFDFGKPINYKYYNQCIITAHSYDDYMSELSVAFEIDIYYKDNIEIINATQSKFGVTTWGEKFNDRNIIKSEWIPLNYRGRTIKFKISNNTIDQTMKIYDINVVYSMRDFR